MRVPVAGSRIQGKKKKKGNQGKKKSNYQKFPVCLYLKTVNKRVNNSELCLPFLINQYMVHSLIYFVKLFFPPHYN